MAKKKWIQGAVKHPGRLTKAAAAAGVSKLQLAEKWSHSKDPSKRGAGILGKRFIKGKLHDGGMVPETGNYELEKGENIMAAGKKKPPMNAPKAIGRYHSGGTIPKDGVYELEQGEKVIPNARKAYEHEEVCAPENTPAADGCGHWEIDGHTQKFVKD